MNVRLLTLAVLASLGALAAPALARAQFQPPTQEELKMTADPKAPGAAAVYLYREETTDDKIHFHSVYVRIKVLTEKGKELATVSIPYEKEANQVTDIRGRTIHSDGSIVPLNVKPTDLLEHKTSEHQMNKKVFTLPSVEVGSILEYRFRVQYDENVVSSPTWEIQQPYFVHKAHYSFIPSTSNYTIYDGGPLDAQSSHYSFLPSLDNDIENDSGESLDMLKYSVHADGKSNVAVDVAGRYSFDIADVPPIPDEDFMPPNNVFCWRVNFYYTNNFANEDFWKEASKHWVRRVEKFSKSGNEITLAAATLYAPTDSETVKATKIYDAVQKLDNTGFSRKKTESELKADKINVVHSVEDVWKQKSGSQKQIALLYVALARAAGLKVWPMQVVNRDRAIFDTLLLSTKQLDDYIVAAKLDGKDVFLDPGQKMCPFGVLHWKHTLTHGLQLTENGPILAATPPFQYKDASYTRVASLTIDEAGNVKGIGRFTLSGPDALLWRQIALQNDAEEVKKQFNESLHGKLPDGVNAEFDHFQGIDDSSAQLSVIFHIKGNLGSVIGKRMILPELFFESHAEHPFTAQDKRTSPIDVHYPELFVDQVIYHLPVGFAVDSLPPVTDIDWTGSAKLHITAETKADVVTVKRTLAYNFTVLDGKNYADLHGFYQKVATADQQQLVLKKAAAPQGN